MNHNSVPKVNRAYIDCEMLAVSFVRMVLMAWGKNDKVVEAAATRPIIVINCTEEILYKVRHSRIIRGRAGSVLGQTSGVCRIDVGRWLNKSCQFL
jgi:hypothetical protein